MTHTTPESPLIPVPSAHRFFFAEVLPAGADTESAADTESRVSLDLESGAPLPLEKLAYGWVRLPSREILYYAAPRDHVPAHDAFAPAGAVLPDAEGIVFPAGVTPEDFQKASRDFHADLRPRPELAQLRARASADKLLSRLTLPLRLGAVAGVLLLLGAGVFAGLAAWQEARLAADAAKLKSAEERADMLATLDRMEAAGHSVFDALAMVNPSRPEGVAFSRVIFSDNRDLTLEGRASDVSAINRMAGALHASGHFGEAKTPKLDASDGRSSFSMKIPVIKWPAIADAATEVPSPGESDEKTADTSKETGA